MTFDPRKAAWLPGWPFGPDSAGLASPTELLRETYRQAAAALEAPPSAVASIRDLSVPGAEDARPARLYTPFGATEAPGPAIVYFHGGGFALGDLATHDGVCRRLAAASRCRVLHVTYRLAPEHPFPAAVTDALAAFAWASGEGAAALGLDPDALAVAGDSAGGNLAATVALEAEPAFQALIYPLLQLVETNADRLRVLEGHVVAHAMLSTARGAYLADPAAAAHPWASPLLRSDIAAAPPTLIVTAGMDPLHDEGRAYAERLAAAGVAVEHRHHHAAVHGFFQFTAASEDAISAIDATGRAVGRALGALSTAGDSAP